eukprot:ANDGO_05871.mRNA.1 hypothetical protein AMSG_11041
MRALGTLLPSIVLFLVLGIVSGIPVSIVKPSGYTEVSSSGESKLLAAQGTGYEEPVYVALLRGDRHAIGYDYGRMLGKDIPPMLEDFMRAVLGQDYKIALLNLFADWQWSVLGQQVPAAFKTELAGINAGCESIGVPSCERLLARILVFSNLPTNFTDYVEIIEDEMRHWLHIQTLQSSLAEDVRDVAVQLADRGTWTSMVDVVNEAASRLHGCSMFGAWGPRTVDGAVVAGRNLDWASNTGISRFKLVTLYFPTDGGRVHATVGFFGFMGALAGMSRDGLTVHEANLEEKTETFYGFPWALRLRWVMEQATDIRTALSVFASTNNTVGYNHQVCSANDNACVLLETKGGYTAVFYANDSREAEATYVDYKGEKLPLGRPMPNATFRTNHGYDPEIRRTYDWKSSDDLFKDSVMRYFLISNQFSTFEESGIAIGPMETVSSVSLLGEKGRNPTVCDPSTYNVAHNILSVAFFPARSTLIAAWEFQTDSSWAPACCSPYVEIDLSQFWSSV